MEMKHAIIFANGELRFPQAVKKIVDDADYLIAADGGFTHLQTLGLKADLLIGDLDSVTPDQIALARQEGCEIRKYPVEKDETDLELALLAAAGAGFERIIIVAALGGRLDQTLSNIGLLVLPQLADLDVRIDDGKELVFLVCSSSEISGAIGDTVSLLPLSPIVFGVTTSGLKYPLQNENLVFSRSRGISNMMLEASARVEIQSGILLCIHTRNEV